MEVVVEILPDRDGPFLSASVMAAHGSVTVSMIAYVREKIRICSCRNSRVVSKVVGSPGPTEETTLTGLRFTPMPISNGLGLPVAVVVVCIGQGTFLLRIRDSIAHVLVSAGRSVITTKPRILVLAV